MPKNNTVHMYFRFFQNKVHQNYLMTTWELVVIDKCAYFSSDMKLDYESILEHKNNIQSTKICTKIANPKLSEVKIIKK